DRPAFHGPAEPWEREHADARGDAEQAADHGAEAGSRERTGGRVRMTLELEVVSTMFVRIENRNVRRGPAERLEALRRELDVLRRVDDAEDDLLHASSRSITHAATERQRASSSRSPTDYVYHPRGCAGSPPPSWSSPRARRGRPRVRRHLGRSSP